jgi:hypothetical protein
MICFRYSGSPVFSFPDLLRDTPNGKPIIHANFTFNSPPSIAGDIRQVSQFGGLPYTVSASHSHSKHINISSI